MAWSLGLFNGEEVVKEWFLEGILKLQFLSFSHFSKSNLPCKLDEEYGPAAQLTTAKPALSIYCFPQKIYEDV